jgi:putative FmdB family regulatory protein
MPTYEYQCDGCEHNFDEFQSITEPALTKCPRCGKRKLRRVFGTGAAVLFKGSGFYQTDYRSESYKSAAKKDQEAAKAGENGKSGAAASSAPSSEASGSASGDAAARKRSEGNRSKSGA